MGDSAQADAAHSPDTAEISAAEKYARQLKDAEPSARQYSSKYQAPAREVDEVGAASIRAEGGGSAEKAKKSMDALFDIPDGIEVGSHFPLFECHDVEGQIISASSLRGKSFVLFGIQSMSVHGDISELREIQQMYGEFSKAGIKVLAICTNTVAECRPIVDKLGLDFSILCDTTGDTITAWGINMNGHRRSKALRAAFLVNNEGTVVYNNVNFKARGGVSALFFKRNQFLNPKALY
eukprot:INCI9177.1.p1 GENE.INCI9177.1~~INCI9177.1.p1  ORF type:complete len:237 (-),score=39.31 INCI9177.1:40-750(-)